MAEITRARMERLIACARRAGFDVAGIAPVPPPDSAEERLQRERFLRWSESGYAGEMAWMLRPDEDGRPLRSWRGLCRGRGPSWFVL